MVNEARSCAVGGGGRQARETEGETEQASSVVLLQVSSSW